MTRHLFTFLLLLTIVPIGHLSKGLRRRIVRATITRYRRLRLPARVELFLVRTACIGYLLVPLPARFRREIDDQVSAMCLYLLDRNEYGFVTAVVETLKLRRIGNEFVTLGSDKMTRIRLERSRSKGSGSTDAVGSVYANTRHDVPSRRPRRATQRLAWIYSEDVASGGSTVMRGRQLSDIARLHLEGDVEVTYANELTTDSITESIVILTKRVLNRISLEGLNALKFSGNIVCADFVDNPIRNELDGCIDVYVASSIHQFIELSKAHSNKLVHLISHHADLRITGSMVREDYCNIGYFGEMKNVLYGSQLGGVVDFCHVSTSKADRTEWMQRLRHFSVHYAVRNLGSNVACKPFVRDFTAARCHANIIVPLDESDARYYLGSDYPYILKDDSLNSVLEMIDYVKDSFGGPDWNRGLEIMQSVRKRCSPTQIASELRALLVQLS